MEKVNVGETVCVICGKKIGLNVMVTSADDGETWYHYFDCLEEKVGE